MCISGELVFEQEHISLPVIIYVTLGKLHHLCELSSLIYKRGCTTHSAVKTLRAIYAKHRIHVWHTIYIH